ncbi:MAG: arsenosugar biosynthesis radical SAM protein ArsS [Porticoccaceae bacterium]|nr:arsenosugar biosynthesis radical SAM protein ArsS [Pseudomonadales bacterium]MCP5172002.1 arsenosugar biosynthesis radical SAM protein ArsS [Pseudomonadales bacterium]
MQDTRPLLMNTDFPGLRRKQFDVLQVNLGYLCNLSCTHCHVNAGPHRTELMSRENIDVVIDVLQRSSIKTLDLTGGAPEMNPDFKYLVEQARILGVDVIDRCNLTILLEPGYEDMIGFLAANQVQVVASLPCYSEQNVSQQRGKGVFESSITALKKLNLAGYGVNSELPLNLVYNPNGAFLPPPQDTLEQEYKQRLGEDFGIVFNDLYTITNMPISRFGAVLLAKGEYSNYLDLLKSNYSTDNLHTLMCLSTVSVDWQGNLYDCDFNQMLALPMLAPVLSRSTSLIASDSRPQLRDLLDTDFCGQSITVGDHCYGCTAGQGSSCGGALDKS